LEHKRCQPKENRYGSIFLPQSTRERYHSFIIGE
jgi:hypothetical protein